MTQPPSEITDLKVAVQRLEDRVAALENDLQRAVKVASGYDELLNKHCKLLQRDLDDAFGRIKNLDLTVFPNLARDIVDVHDVIGDGEDKADNPLDHRGKT